MFDLRMTRTIPVDPPRPVWVRQSGGARGEVGVPGWLSAWRVHLRKGRRWEGWVVMLDEHGRRTWTGWVPEANLLPAD